MNLLEKAKQAPEPELSTRRKKWEIVAPAIQVLRDKGYTNRQISEWLNKEGLNCSMADVAQAYQRYIKEKQMIDYFELLLGMGILYLAFLAYINLGDDQMLTKEEEYHAKYITLASWASDRTGLSSEVIQDIVDKAWEKNMKQDLEDYCEKLYEGDDVDEV